MKWFLGIVGLFYLQAQGEVMSLQKLNQHLKASGAQWEARDNWLNHLSKEELVNMMGAKGVAPHGVDFSTKNFSSRDPEIFDWRNVEGKNYVSPILNQGNCGSCVAFAAVATLETQMNIAVSNPLFNPKYSTEALFACGGGACHSGWWPSSAAMFLKNKGVPDEACAPYTMGATGKDVSCSSICKDASQRTQKVIDYTSPEGIDDVKKALKKGPMITTLYVYADFITYSSGVYKHTTGSGLGGHAVSLIGFDDEKRAWIIRNSWGTDWGMQGFGYVSYDDVSGISENNHQLAVETSTDYLWSDLVDRSFIWAQSDLHVTGSGSESSPIAIAVSGADGSLGASMTCTQPSCLMSLDTRDWADGKYFLTATQGAKTLHRYFYVANHPSDFDLQMRLKDLDAKKPVKGRIEFNVAIGTQSANPLQRLALVYQNQSGETKERWTTNIANDMTLGWRTPLVPNGIYTVWIKGEAAAGGSTATFESERMTLEIKN